MKPTEGKAFIYTADALYTIENMEKSIPPPPALVADLSALMQTINWYKLEAWTSMIVPFMIPNTGRNAPGRPAELVPSRNSERKVADSRGGNKSGPGQGLSRIPESLNSFLVRGSR